METNKKRDERNGFLNSDNSKNLNKILIILILSVFFIAILSGKVSAISFNSTWNTTATSTGSSNSTSVSLPLESSGSYDLNKRNENG